MQIDESQARAADARYWQFFNACDLRALEDLSTDDIEFHHERTGLTASKMAVTDSLRKGPCNGPALHLRRDAGADHLQQLDAADCAARPELATHAPDTH